MLDGCVVSVSHAQEKCRVITDDIGCSPRHAHFSTRIHHNPASAVIVALSNQHALPGRHGSPPTFENQICCAITHTGGLPTDSRSKDKVVLVDDDDDAERFCCFTSTFAVYDIDSAAAGLGHDHSSRGGRRKGSQPTSPTWSIAKAVYAGSIRHPPRQQRREGSGGWQGGHEASPARKGRKGSRRWCNLHSGY